MLPASTNAKPFRTEYCITLLQKIQFALVAEIAERYDRAELGNVRRSNESVEVWLWHIRLDAVANTAQLKIPAAPDHKRLMPQTY